MNRCRAAGFRIRRTMSGSACPIVNSRHVRRIESTTAGTHLVIQKPRPILSLQDRVRRKIAFRILPLVFVLYMIAYLDRANVAFGKATMSADLGFSDAVFGFGAG